MAETISITRDETSGQWYLNQQKVTREDIVAAIKRYRGSGIVFSYDVAGAPKYGDLGNAADDVIKRALYEDPPPPGGGGTAPSPSAGTASAASSPGGGTAPPVSPDLQALIAGLPSWAQGDALAQAKAALSSVGISPTTVSNAPSPGDISSQFGLGEGGPAGVASGGAAGDPAGGGGGATDLGGFDYNTAIANENAQYADQLNIHKQEFAQLLDFYKMGQKTQTDLTTHQQSVAEALDKADLLGVLDGKPTLQRQLMQIQTSIASKMAQWDAVLSWTQQQMSERMARIAPAMQLAQTMGVVSPTFLENMMAGKLPDPYSTGPAPIDFTGDKLNAPTASELATGPVTPAPMAVAA